MNPNQFRANPYNVSKILEDIVGVWIPNDVSVGFSDYEIFELCSTIAL